MQSNANLCQICRSFLIIFEFYVFFILIKSVNINWDQFSYNLPMLLEQVVYLLLTVGRTFDEDMESSLEVVENVRMNLETTSLSQLSPKVWRWTSYEVEGAIN